MRRIPSEARKNKGRSLPADQTREKQRLFSVRIERFHLTRLSGARPLRCDKSRFSECFEALFCFGYGFAFIRIEPMTAIASVIHHYLDCHGMLLRF